MSYITKYPIESTEKLIVREGGHVQGKFNCDYGYIIWWSDEKGHSLTTVTRTSSGTGSTFTLGNIKEEFIKEISYLLKGTS